MGNNPSKKAQKKKDETESTSTTTYSSSTNNSANTRTSNTTVTTSNTSTSPTKINNTSPSITYGNTNGTNSNPGSGVSSPKTTTSNSSSGADDKNKKLDEFFDKYKDESDPTTIGPDGIDKLCKDLNVQPEDILVLVLAWHLNAQNMGFFSKKEFVTGLSKLGVDSLSKLQAQLPNFKKDLDDNNNFKEIYRFAFLFAKENEHKILELGNACDMMSLVLCQKYPHVSKLVDYLSNHQTTYRGLNMDQWLSIYEFAKVISADTSNYDENGAWPVLLDEYVDWVKSNK